MFVFLSADFESSSVKYEREILQKGGDLHVSVIKSIEEKDHC